MISATYRAESLASGVRVSAVICRCLAGLVPARPAPTPQAGIQFEHLAASPWIVSRVNPPAFEMGGLVVGQVERECVRGPPPDVHLEQRGPPDYVVHWHHEGPRHGRLVEHTGCASGVQGGAEAPARRDRKA
jgi:hypothetical protein